MLFQKHKMINLYHMIYRRNKIQFFTEFVIVCLNSVYIFLFFVREIIHFYMIIKLILCGSTIFSFFMNLIIYLLNDGTGTNETEKQRIGCGKVVVCKPSNMECFQCYFMLKLHA